MRVALIDGGSFVMPYNLEFSKAATSKGIMVEYYGSTTGFNGEYLNSLRALPSCTAQTRKISSSTGRPAFVRMANYAALLFSAWRGADDVDAIVLEFAPAWPLDLIFSALVRKRLAFIVHNVVPHGWKKQTYLPFRLIGGLAAEVWCVSEHTATEVRFRYPSLSPKIRVVPHGPMGALPNSPKATYVTPKAFSSVGFWGTVKPYKGVDRLLGACRENAIRRAFSTIEIHGRWSESLVGLREEISASGALVHNDFLTSDALGNLLSRDNLLFLLPYHAASQSGVFYTLLHHARYFVASDTGEIGRFLRSFELDCLLTDDFDLATIESRAKWIIENGVIVRDRMRRASAAISWDQVPIAIKDLAERAKHGGR